MIGGLASSLAEERDDPPELWDALADLSESADTGVVFIAVEQSAWLGMAGGYVHKQDRSVATVWGMWVEGPVRRREIARRVLEWPSSCAALSSGS
jgi:acetyltransferase (GNAT) family protein